VLLKQHLKYGWVDVDKRKVRHFKGRYGITVGERGRSPKTICVITPIFLMIHVAVFNQLTLFSFIDGFYGYRI